MHAQIYAEVLWLLHQELMTARGHTDSKSYPHVHLLHDRAPGHMELNMPAIIESLNMSATVVTLTPKLIYLTLV